MEVAQHHAPNIQDIIEKSLIIPKTRTITTWKRKPNAERNWMVQLSDKDFKATTIKVLQWSVTLLNEEIENLTKESGIIKIQKL